MFVVELVGLPGVGKSTIANAVTNCINTERNSLCLTADDAFLYSSRLHTDKACRILLNIVPHQIARVLIKKISKRTIFQHDKAVDFLIQHYEAINTIFNGETFNKMSYADQHVVISGILHAGAIYGAIRSIENFNKIVFFDEGFIQSSLFMGSPGDLSFNIDEILEYINHIPLPDLVIYLKSDIGTCLDRMSKREKGLTQRLRRLERSKIYKSLQLVDQIFAKIIEFLSMKSVDIVELDSKSTIDDTAQSISRAIQPFIEKYIGNTRKE